MTVVSSEIMYKIRCNVSSFSYWNRQNGDDEYLEIFWKWMMCYSNASVDNHCRCRYSPIQYNIWTICVCTICKWLIIRLYVVSETSLNVVNKFYCNISDQFLSSVYLHLHILTFSMLFLSSILSNPIINIWNWFNELRKWCSPFDYIEITNFL